MNPKHKPRAGIVPARCFLPPLVPRDKSTWRNRAQPPPGAASPSKQLQKTHFWVCQPPQSIRVTLRLQRSRDKMKLQPEAPGQPSSKEIPGFIPFPALLTGQTHLKGFLCFKLDGRTETRSFCPLKERGIQRKRFSALREINTNPKTWAQIPNPRDSSRTALGLPLEQL